MAGKVFRIIDFGGERVDSTRGGYGTEYYAVIGFGPDEREGPYTEGLPRKGAFHVHSEQGYMGIVQDVAQVKEIGPNASIFRVRYSVGGTFNFGTTIGSRGRTIVDVVTLPIFQKYTPEVGPPSYIQPNPPTTVMRYGIEACVSRRYVGSVDTIRNQSADNIGKLYTQSGGLFVPASPNTPAGRMYRLSAVSFATDSGNNTRIDTYFHSFSGLPSYPPGTLPNFGDVNIPELPPNGAYIANVRAGSALVAQPSDLFQTGGALVWMQ